ncbi:hypothetical protein J1N35_029367 [Gossypium stocksii]|uniref:Uncharacterized protein n=1 Tax=Gossypium stocksii TaxID=47602 RepID=A0A9D3UXJ5_9ROSI|nr:hypothetical protein J1N35_029367 [Gossypium stocksii]
MSQKLLCNILFHSSASGLQRRRPPRVFAAKGRPPHLLTIASPISIRSGCLSPKDILQLGLHSIFERIERREKATNLVHNSSLIFGFDLDPKSFSRDLVQEVLGIINSIFELISPTLDIWVGILLIFSIIQHSFHRHKGWLQFLQQHSFKFLSFGKPQNIPRNNPIKQHLNGSREKSFTHHGHGLKEDEKGSNSKERKRRVVQPKRRRLQR